MCCVRFESDELNKKINKNERLGIVRSNELASSSPHLVVVQRDFIYVHIYFFNLLIPYRLKKLCIRTPIARIFFSP